MGTLNFENHMRAADALMWTIERDPVLRSTITAVALLDQVPDWESLRAAVGRAAVVVPRLHQRVVEPPVGPPQWVDVGGVDLTYHLRRVKAPEPANLATVLDMAAVDAMAGFDRARPLWEFTVIEGLVEGRAALIQKIHHSMTDGVGAVTLAAELFDTERTQRPRVAPPLRDDAVTSEAITRRGLADTASAAARSMTHAVPWFAAAGGRFLTHPMAAGTDVVAFARSAAKLLAPVTAPLSPAMLGRGLSWHFDAFEVDLAALKAAAGENSLNDAFLAAVTGGLRRYHAHHGHRVAQLRMTMPVSIRTADDLLGGNRFVPVRFAVPIEIADPAERMREVGRLARQWRHEPAMELTDALAAALNALPAAAVTALFGGMLKNIDFVSTNIPGFPTTVYIGGAAVTRQYAFAPPSGAAVNVALLTYTDTCCVGVNSDTAAVPDPAVLIECLQEGFDEVLSLALRPIRAS